MRGPDNDYTLSTLSPLGMLTTSFTFCCSHIPPPRPKLEDSERYGRNNYPRNQNAEMEPN